MCVLTATQTATSRTISRLSTCALAFRIAIDELLSRAYTEIEHGNHPQGTVSYAGLFLRRPHLQGRGRFCGVRAGARVSSCGATGEEAQRNIRGAVRGFLAASADLDTRRVS